MYSICLIVISFITGLVNAQECSFPNQRCVCMTSTPLCRCQSITSDSTLNFSSSYKSHLILQAGLGCLPCPSSCLDCISPTNCTSCQEQFILVNNLCTNCPTNCRACKIVNSSSTIIFQSFQCTSCKVGYFLDSKFQCQMCPLDGSQICTADTLTSCLPNYWLDNNGATCISCDENCRQCSSTTKCSLCNDGYYVSSYKCIKCMNQCLTCTSSASCSICLISNYYFDSTTANCMKCGTGCLQCLNASACVMCGDTNNTQYTLSQNGSCIVTNLSLVIKNCLQNKYFNSTLRCTKCLPDYYQEIGDSTCRYGCSLLCSQCQGAHYGLCSSCQQNAILFNRHCIVKNNINNGTAYQVYFTASHNYNSFSTVSNSSLNLVNRLTNPCLRESVMMGSSIKIDLNNLQAYKIVLKWKVYINSSNSDYSYSVKFANNQSLYRANFTCRNLMDSNCSNFCISKANLSISFNIAQYNTLYLETNNIIGLSQLLVTSFRCGGVQGSSCLQCSQINTCTKCVNPQYFILDQLCLQECPSNYYLYLPHRKCYKVCPLGTFNDLNNLNSRICYTCQSSCQTCSSNTTCHSCNINFYLLEEKEQCLSECPKRFFPNQYLRKCQKCSFPCFQCETNQFCASCRYGFFQNRTKSCTIACPAGYYGNLQTRICEMCESPCRTCQSSSTSCLECDQNHIQFYGQCLQECPNGFFLTTTSSDRYCSPCDTLCESCINQTFCTSCLNGYLHQNQCLLQCPTTYYPSVLTKECHICPQNCLVCTNLTHCTLCLPPTYLNPLNSICTTQCSQLQYPQQQNYGIVSDNIQINASFICKPCVSPCYSCLSYYECLSCDSAFLLGSSCVEVCIEGTFKNQFNMTCTKCPINCTLCDSQSICTLCDDGFILFQGTCSKDCPAFYYLDQSKKTCSQCSLECSKCLNSTFCFNCTLGLLSFVTGKCVQDCPTGYWPDINFTHSCIKCSGFCSVCVVNITDYTQHCTLCISPYFLTSKNQCQLQCSFNQFGASGQCYKCSKPCLSCSSQSECIGCLDKYGYAFLGDCLSVCPIGYYSEKTQYGNICVKCPQSCISCYILANNTVPTCNQCEEGFFLIKKFGKCVTEQQCEQFSFNQTAESNTSYYASSVLRICSKCAIGCLSCSGQSYNCSSCYGTLFYFQNKCLHICPTGYFENNKQCEPCDNQLTNPNETKCAKCRNKQVCLQCFNNYYLFAYSTSNSLCLDRCPSGYYGKAGRCSKCKYPCLQCDSIFSCSLCQNNYILLGSSNQSSCVLQCPTGFYTQAIFNQNLNESFKNCSRCPQLCLQCATSTQCLVCDQTSVLVNKTCLTQCPKGTFRFYGSCPSCMYGCSSCADSYTCNECMIGFLYEGQCVDQCPYGLIQQVNNSNSSSCIYCNPSCLTCKISSDICTSCSYPLYLYLEQCIEECLDGSYPSLELRQCITCTKPCQTCSNSQSCETCIYGYILYIERSRKQCVKGPLCPNSYYLDILDNYCKLECNTTQLQYSQPVSRTCSRSCPQGFAAYKQNMTCLYECPIKNMWIDQNVNCQNDRNSLSEFISSKLPFFNCSISGYLNIFQVICIFSTPIENLGTIRKQNIIIEQMQVLEVTILDTYQGIKIFAQPTNAQQTKYAQKWVKISIRPRYIFRGFNSVHRRYLATSDKSYPLQNSDFLVLVPLFNFYSQEQRQTGYYLNQLSNGISIAALIIWIFSVIKNKKQVNLVMVNGLQWLYILGTLHQNHYPPNILNFIEGFKLSFLIFGSIIPDESSGFAVNSSDRVWLSSFQIRTQLITPTNLTNYKMLAIPIGILISIFLLLFVILQIICKVTRKISQIIPQQSNNKQQERKQKIKDSKQKKWSQDMYKKVNILLQRFRFNYVHQILLLITFPTSFLFFCQVSSPQLIGLIVSLFLILCLIVSWVHIGWELNNNKFFLFKEQGYKYYLIFGIENFFIGFICIFASTTFYLGSSAIICLLNLYIYCLIFNVCEWKLKFWCILDLFKFFIVISLLACYLLAQTQTRDTMFLLGWAPTILTFIYVIILTICASRHFFEQESILFQQLKNEYKKRKLKSRSNIEKSLLETDSLKKISKKDVEQTTTLLKYQSEQSFFEDEQEVTHTDSEQQSTDQILQISQNSRQNKRKQSIPKILIKRKSQIQ